MTTGELDEHKITEKPEESKGGAKGGEAKKVQRKEGKRKRRVEKKRLYICKAVGTADPSEADTFSVVAGPMKDITASYKHVRDELPDGSYVLMYEGKTIEKTTQRVSRVVM